jgi:uncharacterized protein
MRRPPTPDARRIGFAELRMEGGNALRRGLAGSPEEVGRWLETAARFGLVEAQVLFGQVLLDGNGVTPDATTAFSWFRIAAEAGYAPGMNMTGRCLEKAWGVGSDLSAAARWYRRAAEASLDWAQYNLANLLLRGRGVAKDRRQALSWFLKAAHQGHAKSMNLVGRFLEEGWEVPPDREAAFTWYRRAAEGGDFRGQFNLAAQLASWGRDAEAVEWFDQAAHSGTPEFLVTMAQWLRQQPNQAMQAIAARIIECGHK